MSFYPSKLYLSIAAAVEVNKCNFGGLLVNSKPKTNTLNKSGIYQLKCLQCGIAYIEQSGRAIKK